MKVVLVRRQPCSGAFSIEELFNAVTAAFGPEVEWTNFELGPRRRVLLDAWRLRRLRADVYHVTGDVNYMTLLLPWRRTLLTVHDIGHYLHGLRGLRRRVYEWLWLRGPMKAAAKLTAISRATAQDVVTHLGIAAERIQVIENCHSPAFRPVARPFNVDRPTILQVGTRSYKNVPRLVAALAGIPCRLVLIGPVDDDLQRALHEHGIDYQNHVNLTHQQVAQAYVDCDIVSFVSIGEGFGVPIIEAQASGRPLVTADASPMREVAGPDACLAKPENVAAIRAAVLKIIHDPQYRQRLVDTGLENARRFSPEQISRQYLALYRDIAFP
ncbi:glycosyltransferase family 1 protein [Ideonella sp. DXS22W]|uniref:Glycosyltransferase family 1 protein n=1 Tax=Pseudaquabacterium inlustre TaxID=2984192 RepID=A0ABU9CFD1_9BURK